MDKANFAEWILRRLVSPTRASEIMGDLLETHSKPPTFRFWFSFAGVLVILSWRSTIGLIAASVASVVLSWLPFVYMATRLSFQTEASFYLAHGSFYIFFGMLLWISAIFSLVRFGPRSRLTQLGLVAALLEVVATATYWMPHAIVIQVLAASLLLVAALFTAGGRKTLGALVPAIVVGEATLYLIGKLPLNGRTPGIGVILIAEILLVTLIECRTLSFLHRKLVE
jgi:hypothetical protein